MIEAWLYVTFWIKVANTSLTFPYDPCIVDFPLTSNIPEFWQQDVIRPVLLFQNNWIWYKGTLGTLKMIKTVEGYVWAL